MSTKQLRNNVLQFGRPSMDPSGRAGHTQSAGAVLAACERRQEGEVLAFAAWSPAQRASNVGQAVRARLGVARDAVSVPQETLLEAMGLTKGQLRQLTSGGHLLRMRNKEEGTVSFMISDLVHYIVNNPGCRLLSLQAK